MSEQPWHMAQQGHQSGPLSEAEMVSGRRTGDGSILDHAFGLGTLIAGKLGYS